MPSFGVQVWNVELSFSPASKDPAVMDINRILITSRWMWQQIIQVQRLVFTEVAELQAGGGDQSAPILYRKVLLDGSRGGSENDNNNWWTNPDSRQQTLAWQGEYGNKVKSNKTSLLQIVAIQSYVTQLKEDTVY